MNSIAPVLVNGEWRRSHSIMSFHAVNPQLDTEFGDTYPVSSRDEVDLAIVASSCAAQEVRGWPGERFANFLREYRDAIQKRLDEYVDIAHAETALPVDPRLSSVEMPRTLKQLGQAADAAEDGSWSRPVIDTQTNIRSMLESIGPVAVFGPNNFPFAFNSMAGGDFAAAVAAGNPVIAKGHPLHPGTTRMFAEDAQKAAETTGMPSGFIQMIYDTTRDGAMALVSDKRIGASAFTGGNFGLLLKEAADRAGKPIYLELSSTNPVLVLPGVFEDREPEDVAEEFTNSCLMGVGQFCTNPGLVILQEGEKTEEFIAAATQQFEDANVGTLLGATIQNGLVDHTSTLTSAGAQLLTGGMSGGGKGISFQNTLFRVSGEEFLKNPQAFQSEGFGNSSLIVVADGTDQIVEVVSALEGNLAGSVYSSEKGLDDAAYDEIEPFLAARVGRLLNDTMPTGVAVVPAMHHGGPYPSTGHPGFTSVGIPASLQRFGKPTCYDRVREYRLPALLRNNNPNGKTWRQIDGEWTQMDIPSS